LQACVLGCISLCIALTMNAFRENGLALLHTSQSASVAQPAVLGLPISPPEAFRLFQSNTALFLDARAPQSFQDGHIPGSFNVMPGTSVNVQDRLKAAPGRVLIVYCDGPECDLAERLARELTGAGFKGVRIMGDGWMAWQGSGYPVETAP